MSEQMTDSNCYNYITNVRALNGQSTTIWFNDFDSLMNQAIVYFNLDANNEIYLINMGQRMTRQSSTPEVLRELAGINTLHIVSKPNPNH